MTSTQKPHITDFKGVVSYTTSLTPAPTVSALNGDYSQQIEAIANELNKLEGDSVHVKKFDSIAKLVELLVELAGYSPYQIDTGKQKSKKSND